MEAPVKEALDRVVTLADNYAAQFVSSLPYAESEGQLRRAMAGILLSFLAESLLMTADE